MQCIQLIKSEVLPGETFLTQTAWKAVAQLSVVLAEVSHEGELLQKELVADEAFESGTAVEVRCAHLPIDF